MRTTNARTFIRLRWPLLFCAPALLPGAAALAQSSENTAVVEEVVVYGTRRTIQDSIVLKRQSVAIVDGLSADEIGDIPALSIGEALETVTGASSHRENGGATEVSIRGLGPFLSNTVINGREATNGGGNRAVNFSIFPSELFNAIGVHKTQSAEYIEGAVAGQIHLNTRRPIDHGQQSIQLNLKGAFNPDEQDIRDGDEVGFRATASYIDQFETQSMGTFGVSIGIQKSDTTNPEQEHTTGTGGGPGAAAYATSKGAVMTFTRAMAKELGPSGIRVNCVCPGMISKTFHDTFTKDEVRANVAAGTPLRREGQAGEVADLVVYLASPESSFITGASLDINGGMYFS